MATTTKRMSVFILLTVLGLLASAPALAVGGGLYLGGSVGGATTDFSQGTDSFDDSDVAWKAFVGYHFLQFFAVEAAYRDLGSPSDSNYKLSTTAFDVEGLVGMPIGPVYLFGKLGIANWDSDFTVNSTGIKTSDDGTGYLGGLGVSVDVIKIQLRAEIEYLDAGEGAVMYTVGAAWRF